MDDFLNRSRLVLCVHIGKYLEGHTKCKQQSLDLGIVGDICFVF